MPWIDMSPLGEPPAWNPPNWWPTGLAYPLKSISYIDTEELHKLREENARLKKALKALLGDDDGQPTQDQSQ